MRIPEDSYTPTLDIVAEISAGAIRASIAELREQDRLTVALRAALRAGISIDELSNESGLSPREIRRRCEGELFLGEDLETLAGIR
jgi:AraC-like DNA-binding protein